MMECSCIVKGIGNHVRRVSNDVLLQDSALSVWRGVKVGHRPED